jgi:prepilin-type N-terminal cleavage/methylation domain-containing protein
MEPFHFLMQLSSFSRRKQVHASRGFTFIEMLVVLGIITILTAVILAGQGNFNRTILLTDTAYTVAESIRETQSLGLSSQKQLAANTTGSAAFGIDLQEGLPTSYIQFEDVAATPASIPSWCPVGTAGTPTAKPGNCVYDGANELLHTFTFNQAFTESFCAYQHINGVLTRLGCSNYGSTKLQSLDIVFQRPNTTTVLTGTLTTGSYTSRQPDTACIDITSPQGNSLYVEVTQLGEVSVVNACT